MSSEHADLTLREMQLLTQQKLDMLISTVERLSSGVEQRLTAGDRRFGEFEMWRQSANTAIAGLDQRTRGLEDSQRVLRDARPIPRLEALEADVKPLLVERTAHQAQVARIEALETDIKPLLVDRVTHQAQLKLVTALFGTPDRIIVTIMTALLIALLTHWLWP